MTISRRKLLAATAGAILAAPAIGRAQQKVIKVASLRTVMTITAHFLRALRGSRLSDRGRHVREPGRLQERRGHAVGGFRHLRHPQPPCSAPPRASRSW
ncbi:MAG: hypothetical protein WDO24_21150 [Pseudomonadota bacterium]